MKLGYFLILVGLVAAASTKVTADAKSIRVELNSLDIVNVPQGSFLYRQSGEFLKDNFPIDAPLVKVTFKAPIHIMKYQVSVGDYEKCVWDEKCEARKERGKQDAMLPATGVSYNNAVSYAQWLTANSDHIWRLPTDEEWSYAAGNRFVDDALNTDKGELSISDRWLERYRKYTDINDNIGGLVKKRGEFGANQYGIYDLSGNVWEWTSNCYKRTRLNASGIEQSVTNNCGVRISAGRHRAYISSFVQDARGGGCSVGAPPSYLGFRLVKDKKRDVLSRLFDFLRL